MIQADAAEKSMFARRATFAVLFSVTMAGSLWLASMALAPGGFGMFDLAALLLFAVTLPWMVAGFCNAVIGFVIMRFSPDAVAAVMPAAGLIQGDEPVTASTAILLCVRNEQPIRIIRNLEPMLDGFKAIGRSPQGHERPEGNADAIEGKKSKEAPARKTAAKPQRKSASASRSQQKTAGNMSSGMNQVQNRCLQPAKPDNRHLRD